MNIESYASPFNQVHSLSLMPIMAVAVGSTILMMFSAGEVRSPYSAIAMQ